MDLEEALSTLLREAGPDITLDTIVTQEDQFGLLQNLMDAKTAGEMKQTLDDCIPEYRRAMRNRGSESHAAGKHIHTSQTTTQEEVVRFEADDLLHAQALNEWFIKHAEERSGLRSFREEVLGESPTTTENLRFLAQRSRQSRAIDGEWQAGTLSGMTLEEAISQCKKEYGEPVERMLSEGEAYAFLASPATRCMSLDQFREWGIPVVAHKASIGVPIGRYRPSDFGAHQGHTVDLTFEPSGETFRLRAPRSFVVDGFKVVPGKKARSYPARPWRAKSTREAVLAVGIRNPGLLKRWEADLADKSPHIERIRKWIEDDQLVLPTHRESRLAFQEKLTFPEKQGDTSSVDVWPGSVLDDLRVLSQGLAKHYHWDQAQATWFVLTGKPPRIRPLESKSITSRGDFTEHIATMEVLLWVSSRTVINLFRQAQKRLVGRNTKRDPLTIEVFRFVTSQVGVWIADDDCRWPELLRQWKAAHANSDALKWPRDLRLYYKRARQSLLLQNYQFPPDPGDLED